MALTKEFETVTTVLPDGQLQVKTIQIIKEDGVEISRTNSRKVIDVGDDTTNEDSMVKDIAKGVHTAARKAERDAKKAAQEAEGG